MGENPEIISGGYLSLCSYGQRPTAELADEKRRQYPEYWSEARVAYAKANQLNAPRVYDCAGLVKSYWMQADPKTPAKYVKKYDKSAAGLKACCTVKGKIAGIPDERGCSFLLEPGTLASMTAMGA